MWTYYFKLSWLSIRKTPVLSVLMVLCIAVGIASCLTTFTMYSVISSNPLAHKNESVFAVQLDSWDPDNEYFDANGIPIQLTYRDARAIMESDIPDKTVIMFNSGISIQRADGTGESTVRKMRVTTRDFFSVFDVDFVKGTPWDDEADRQGENVVVINESLQKLMFGTDESLGKPLSLEGELYTVVGVVDDDWHLVPNVYDLNNNPFDTPPFLYIPFMNVQEHPFQNWGNTNGWNSAVIDSYQAYLDSELIWIQGWVELSTLDTKQQFSNFLQAYINEQKKIGRFQRPLKYLLNTPEEWLDINEVVGSDTRVLLVLSISFLLVCLVNTIVMLLAKFLKKAPEAGVRRALGASRQSIFSQHVCEALLIGVLGAILGLLFSWQGLAGVRALYQSYNQVATLSGFTVLAAIVLAIVTSFLSGAFPAWRISHTQPASYLKTN